MFFLVYKTTNKINGKCYVGSHKTENLDDGYLGSGKYLRRAISEHGPENFVRKILFKFDNPEDMYAKEAEIVNADFLMNENTYNLKIGGYGGFDHINRDEKSRREKNQKARKTTNERHKDKLSEWAKLGAITSMKIHGNPNKTGTSKGFTGKKHSEETLQKMRAARAKR